MSHADSLLAGHVSVRPVLSHPILRSVGVLAAWLWLLLLVRLAVSLPAYRSSSITAGPDGSSQMFESTSTLFERNPGPVRVIGALLFAACLVSSASFLWRLFRRSTHFGVSALVVTGFVGLLSFAGMLTIGPVVMPLFMLLLLASVPVARKPVAVYQLPSLP